jgi:hypothetical protein|tara:strand:- start:74 stop:394 length:321 start_codon:yes stop_codon:yes gene_type:complete
MSHTLTFVLRNSLGDSTANGLTSREDSIILHHGDGVDLADLILIPDDELVLVERQLFGKPAWYAKPAGLLKSNTHSMFGGNFIYTSHSGFPSESPIQVHDRVEKNY